MQLRRDEILTGTMVIATAAVLTATVIALCAPGVLRSVNTYYVSFDNAGGVQAGTQVFLAGRRVGQVVGLESPVPMSRRPPDHPEHEALVEIRVSKDARIYRSVAVRMQQYGWFGQQMIDFVRGDEQSGLAPSGTAFAGERASSIGDVSEEAAAALTEMTESLANINALTRKGGDLQQTAANAREFTDTIKREPWRLLWKTKKHYPRGPESETAEQGRSSAQRPVADP